MAETKLLGPTTTIWWFDLTAITTPEAPKVADMTAALAKAVGTAGYGRNVSVAMAKGYTLNPQDSDTNTDGSIVDTGAGETRGAANYEGMFPFFLEADADTNTESLYQEAYEMFKVSGKTGYAIRRLGALYTVAPAAGQLVDIFKFQTGMPRLTEPDNNSGAFHFDVPLFKQGFVRTNIALVA